MRMASGGGSSRTSLVVAAGVAAVEALKDQAGLCRWNYALRSLHQRAENKVAAFHRRGNVAPPSAASAGEEEEEEEEGRRRSTVRLQRAKETEETLRKVMHLDAWGPK